MRAHSARREGVSGSKRGISANTSTLPYRSMAARLSELRSPTITTPATCRDRARSASMVSKRVIDGSERRASHDHDREAQPHHQVRHGLGIVQGCQYSARSFDDPAFLVAGSPFGQRFEIDSGSRPFRGQVRRDRITQTHTFITVLHQSGQAANLGRVVVGFDSGLDGLPVPRACG